MDTCHTLKYLLEEVLVNIQPSEEDYNKRLGVLSSLRRLAEGLDCLKAATLLPFGSFESNLYTKWGDLDISIELSTAVHKKTKNLILRKLEAALRKRVTTKVEFIPWARVPLICFEDPSSKISCDISVNNESALLKSKYLSLICEMDPRVRDLVFLIKYWAKANDVNDPKKGSLNSYSVTMLVIFHLQKLSPPIIPPFKEIYDGDISDELKGGSRSGNHYTFEGILHHCTIKVRELILDEYGRKNQSSVPELFVSFFNQYAKAMEIWSQGLAMCIFTGKWVHIEHTQIHKNYSMVIVDPIDHRENCARTVSSKALERLYHALRETSETLQKAPGSISIGSLRNFLFGYSQSREGQRTNQASSKKPQRYQNKKNHVEEMMANRGQGQQNYVQEILGNNNQSKQNYIQETITERMEHVAPRVFSEVDFPPLQRPLKQEAFNNNHNSSPALISYDDSQVFNIVQEHNNLNMLQNDEDTVQHNQSLRGHHMVSMHDGHRLQTHQMFIGNQEEDMQSYCRNLNHTRFPISKAEYRSPEESIQQHYFASPTSANNQHGHPIWRPKQGGVNGQKG